MLKCSNECRLPLLLLGRVQREAHWLVSANHQDAVVFRHAVTRQLDIDLTKVLQSLDSFLVGHHLPNNNWLLTELGVSQAGRNLTASVSWLIPFARDTNNTITQTTYAPQEV